jgi:hypothetical protein
VVGRTAVASQHTAVVTTNKYPHGKYFREEEMPVEDCEFWFGDSTNPAREMFASLFKHRPSLLGVPLTLKKFVEEMRELGDQNSAMVLSVLRAQESCLD